jgi:hypothetical protein
LDNIPVSRPLPSLRAALSLLALATVLLAPALARAEVLYLALEVRQEGRVVARPRLLGETGKRVLAQKRRPGAPRADYQLTLTPNPEGEGFALSLDLTVGEVRGHQDVALLHGEERRLTLGEQPGSLEVSVLLMRVDSPEFRALMDLPPGAPPPAGPRSI